MVDTGFVQRPDARLHYQADHRSDAAPWLVFCNSLLTDLTVWDGQMDAFRERFNILRYDQRGHGKSTDPDQPLNFDILGSDAIAVMTQCGVRSATFIGLSMGTPTALDVWAKRPDLIDRLILCDGQARPSPQGIALWDQRVDEARQIGLEAYCKATLKRWFGADFLQSHPERAQQFQKMMIGTRFTGFEFCVRALQSFDYTALLPKIDIPTQIIVGADDGGLPDVMRKMQNSIHDCQLAEIKNAGHIPNVEQPSTFNQTITAFVENKRQSAS
ncbi:MAG: alpha/beta fold hydrolase [Sulfitobacter sp.]